MRHDTQKIAGDSDVWAFMPGADTQRLPFGNIQFHTANLLVADVRSHLSLCRYSLCSLFVSSCHLCQRLWPQGLLQAKMLKLCVALPSSVRMVDLVQFHLFLFLQVCGSFMAQDWYFLLSFSSTIFVFFCMFTAGSDGFHDSIFCHGVVN